MSLLVRLIVPGSMLPNPLFLLTGHLARTFPTQVIAFGVFLLLVQRKFSSQGLTAWIIGTLIAAYVSAVLSRYVFIVPEVRKYSLKILNFQHGIEKALFRRVPPRFTTMCLVYTSRCTLQGYLCRPLHRLGCRFNGRLYAALRLERGSSSLC